MKFFNFLTPSPNPTTRYHDELVFEVLEKELKAVQQLVKEEMANVVELSISLEVEIHWGKNWNEAH